MKLTDEQIAEMTTPFDNAYFEWLGFARAIESAVREQVIEECAGLADRIPLEYFASDSYIRQSKSNRQQIVASIRALSEKS